MDKISRQILTGCRRVLIKIGSQALSTEKGFNNRMIERLCDELSLLQDQGREVGTFVRPRRRGRLTQKDHWINFVTRPKGKVIVDPAQQSQCSAAARACSPAASSMKRACSRHEIQSRFRKKRAA